MQKELIQSAIALVAWTHVMWFFMYATRLPASFKNKVDFNKTRSAGTLPQYLPEKVNWVADNYNHLHAQPVIFYAICFVLAILNSASATDVKLAWAYVFFKVAHSLWQSTINYVPVRFALFVFGSLVLMAMTASAVSAAFF